MLTVTVPNEYAKGWVEKNALKEIRTLLEGHFPTIDSLRVVVAPAVATAPESELPLLSHETVTPEQAPEERTTVSHAPKEKKFNPNYTFDTFIVGNNNRLAFAAAQVVAEKPGESYNPLFIYGGVGLGKTHLVQAIANEVSRRDPNKKIIYISCETFTSEFIHALQNKTIDQFKNKYRSVDVFLVDDIQFLANKEGTQEEFFHTFNILYQANRQVVVTSDRVPKAIPNLEERLSSRFGWGMIADVQAPNFETRLAILQEKAKERGEVVSSDVLEYVANSITSNVRELEGSLTKLVTSAKIEELPITLEFAERTLRDLASRGKANLSTKKVLQVVAHHFNIDVIDILGKKRIKELVYPRQLAMYLLREHLRHSYPQIGEALGGKDHTTVMHSVDKITKAKKNDSTVEKDISLILQELYR